MALTTWYCAAPPGVPEEYPLAVVEEIAMWPSCAVSWGMAAVGVCPWCMPSTTVVPPIGLWGGGERKTLYLINSCTDAQERNDSDSHKDTHKLWCVTVSS